MTPCRQHQYTPYYGGLFADEPGGPRTFHELNYVCKVCDHINRDFVKGPRYDEVIPKNPGPPMYVVISKLNGKSCRYYNRNDLITFIRTNFDNMKQMCLIRINASGEKIVSFDNCKNEFDAEDLITTL